MKDLLVLLYLACFAACGWPGIVRIVRRRQSDDLSYWREILLLVGVSAQFAVMQWEHVSIRVWISPVNTFLSVISTLVAIWWFRSR